MMINIRTYLLRLWNNMKTKDEGCWCTTDWLFQKLLIGFQFSKVLNYQRRNGRNSEILHQMTLSLILDDVIVEAILKLYVNILNFPAELENTFFSEGFGAQCMRDGASAILSHFKKESIQLMPKKWYTMAIKTGFKKVERQAKGLLLLRQAAASRLFSQKVNCLK